MPINGKCGALEKINERYALSFLYILQSFQIFFKCKKGIKMFVGPIKNKQSDRISKLEVFYLQASNARLWYLRLSVFEMGLTVVKTCYKMHDF